MKALSNIKATVSGDGKSITINADIIEKVYNHILVRRVTCGHLNPKNMRHVRHVQISDQGIFVKRCGQGFCLELDDVVAVAAQVNPMTSFAPVVENVKGQTAVTVVSELPYTVEWQFSTAKMTNKQTVWNAIADSNNVALTPAANLKGNWVRAIATNAVAATLGLPMIVK